MPTTTDSVQQAHDALLAMGNADHACSLCPSAGSTNSAREEAHVADNPEVARFSEAQHFALLEAAVERETAELKTAKGELEAQIATLMEETTAQAAKVTDYETRISVLEAEKASADAAAEAAKQELVDYKAEQERAAEVAALRESREKTIRKANANLDDSFFTEERISRWAEMSEEAFAEVAAAFEAGSKVAVSSKEAVTEQARETAAFSGDSEAQPTGGTSLTTFLGARRRSA